MKTRTFVQSRIATMLRIFVTLTIVMPMLGCGWLGRGRGVKEDPEAIALLVNGDPVLNREVEAMKKAIIAYAPQDYPKDEIAVMGPRIEQEARENLIRERLLDQAVELEGIDPTPAQVEAEMQTLREYLTANGSSLTQHIKSRKTTEEGVRSEVRVRLSRDLLVDKLMGYRAPTEAEARGFFTQNRSKYNWPESVRLSQILVADADGFLPGLDKNKGQRTKAEGLREQLLAGMDFAALARASSDDPSAESGGDLGWIVQGARLPPEVMGAAFQLPPGQISPVLASMQGFHIIKVNDQRQAHEASFEEVREIVEHDYHQAWRANKMPEMIARLREQARIVEPSVLE